MLCKRSSPRSVEIPNAKKNQARDELFISTVSASGYFVSLSDSPEPILTAISGSQLPQSN